MINVNEWRINILGKTTGKVIAHAQNSRAEYTG